MTIINTILNQSRKQNPHLPSPIRQPLRRTLLALDDLLFDLERGGIPDEYCFEQLEGIEDRLKRIKLLMERGT